MSVLSLGMHIGNFVKLNIPLNKFNNGTPVSKPLFLHKDLERDVFQRSNISFSGSIYEDETPYEEKEAHIGGYIDAFCDKKFRNIFMSRKNENLARFNIETFDDNNGEISFINKVFESGGIKTIFNLDMFIQTYGKDSRLRKIFEFQDIEAIKIYGQLSSKDDIKKFPELLLFLYYQKENSEEFSFLDLNEITTFLKNIGLKSFSEFDEKFGYLKSYFNDFEDIADKGNAILWLQESYDEKIGKLNELIQQNPNLKGQTAEKIYSCANDIVDYYYIESGEESIEDISEILEIIATQGKFKKQPMSKIAGFFNEFKTPEDKIAFYKLLTESKVSANDFNDYLGSLVISDTDVIANISNKEYFTSLIGEIRSTKKDANNEFYKSFKDVINATCDTTSKTNDNLRLLIEVIESYGIKNSNSMLSFYNKATGKNSRLVTSEEFRNFIDLFNYQITPPDNKKAISIKPLLKEKEQFESVKEQIKEARQASNSILFKNLTSLEIYKKYRSLILQSKDIKRDLENVAKFQIETSEEYSDKMKYIEDFREFFESDNDLVSFLKINGIKLNGNEEEDSFIQNCITWLDFVKNNDDLSQEHLKYFTQSDFLAKSQGKLEEFLEKTSNEKTRAKIISIIANKEISSLVEMEEFFKQYKLPNSKGKKLLNFIKNLPEDINFNQCQQTLNLISEKISYLQIPLQINENNIDSINIEKYSSTEAISNSDICSLLNELYGTKEDFNFLRTISTTPITYKQKFDSHKIAYEIAKTIDKSEESYQNISRLLGLDKKSLGLKEECPFYTYITAIMRALPTEFINFVNSDEWLECTRVDNTIPKLSLHARLRLLDRFILNDSTNINELFTSNSKEKIKNLLETIFKTQPKKVKGSTESKRYIVSHNYNSQVVESIFTKQGEMLTVCPTKSYRQ